MSKSKNVEKKTTDKKDADKKIVEKKAPEKKVQNKKTIIKKIENQKTFCGYVAIVGRPNVGKSTLINNILGEKLSIITPKPQTTRHRILGVKTKKTIQIIYVDTPGIHIGEKHEINKIMNKTATSSLKDVDVVVFMVQALIWTDEDKKVLTLLNKVRCPVILAVNKVDEISDKTRLLPWIKEQSEKFNFTDIVPLSAKTGDNVGALERLIEKFLPESPHYFPEGQITDRNISFRLSEIIREKLMIELEEEVPYGISVEIDLLEKDEGQYFISAIIWVERSGQKPIVIGKKGALLKRIGMQSRNDMEEMLKEHVHLKLWVKIKEGWSDNARMLKSLGYLDLP